jgi:serine O-acetyltransferase
MASGLEAKPAFAAATALRKIRADFVRWSEVGNFKPSARSFLRLSLLHPGFQLSVSVRLQEAVRTLPLVGKPLLRSLWYFSTIWFGAEISTGARIGAGLCIPHTPGIVIGDGVVIGNNVMIYQGVTLGRAEFHRPAVPTVESNVTIYAGAKVVGGIVVGEGSRIAGNAVVLADVPPYHSAVGIPARNLPPREQTSNGSPGAKNADLS